jgi:hypothetical protein
MLICPLGHRWPWLSQMSRKATRESTLLGVHFSAQELADLPRSIARLIFAAQDMAESSAAAECLLERNDLSGDVRRAPETAVPAAYARPWGKSNTIGGLESHWLPKRPDYQSLHTELINVRNKVYAHTDEEIAARGIEDVSAIAGVPGPFYVPAWHPLNPDLLPTIAELAESEKERFVEAVQELQRRLGSSRS